MIKLICLINRPGDVPPAAFQRWWLEHHAFLARQLPGLRRYTISTCDGEGKAPYDGVAELWFDSEGAMDAAFASGIGAEVSREDAERIGRRVAFTTQEHVIL